MGTRMRVMGTRECSNHPVMRESVQPTATQHRLALRFSRTAADNDSLDSFLELKLENERLREELRELQADMDEDYEPRTPIIPRPPTLY